LGAYDAHYISNKLKSNAEIAIGSHEKRIPKGSVKSGNGVAILPTKALKTEARTSTSTGEMISHTLPMDTPFSLSKFLSHNSYRPTISYLYSPSDMGVSAVHEFEMLDYQLQASTRTMTDSELLDGMHEIGVLITGHDWKSWWVGSKLTIPTCKSLVPGYNPCIIHRAAGVVSALHWSIKNPNQGLLYPEQLPHHEILETVRDYLDVVVSTPLQWDTLTTRHTFSLWDYGTTFGYDDFPKESEMWDYAVGRTCQIALENV